MINTEPEASYKQLPFQQYYGQISMYLCMKNNFEEGVLRLEELKQYYLPFCSNNAYI